MHFRGTPHGRRLASLAAFALLVAFRPAPAPAEPDEALLGKAKGYPLGSATSMYFDPFKIGSFSAVSDILKTRPIARGDDVAALERDADAQIVYRFQGREYALDDYLERRRVTGLLVLKEGRIVAERYRYDRNEKHRFISFSVAKSINSLLLGIALDKGLIKSLDDPAEKYVAELRGSEYGRTTLRNLLHMSSGVKFVEEYNGFDDIARLRKASNGESSERSLDVLASFRERRFTEGEEFTYSSAETMVLGYVVSRAAGKNVATLTCEWLWQPLGAEAEACWIIGGDGQEQVMGGFNAVLRDYGRLGRLLADDGRVGERQVVPLDYLLDATDVARQPDPFRPGKASSYYGYGYQFWLLPMKQRTFALLGIFGQAVYVQPRSKVVLVLLSAQASPRSAEANEERDALWRGVLQSLGGDTRP